MIFIINAEIWKRGTKIEMIVNYGVQLKLKSLQWSKHSHSFINYYPLSIYFKILMYKSVINSWNLFYRNMGKYQKKNLLCFRLKWPSVIGWQHGGRKFMDLKNSKEFLRQFVTNLISCILWLDPFLQWEDDRTLATTQDKFLEHYVQFVSTS